MDPLFLDENSLDLTIFVELIIFSFFVFVSPKYCKVCLSIYKDGLVVSSVAIDIHLFMHFLRFLLGGGSLIFVFGL